MAAAHITTRTHHNRAWPWAVGAHALTLVLFILHVSDEGRNLIGPAFLWAVGPALVVLALGAVVAFLGYSWGMGMAVGAQGWMLLAGLTIHLQPGTPAGTGLGWSPDTQGILSALVSILLFLAMLAGVAFGLAAVMQERRVEARAPGAVRTL